MVRIRIAEFPPIGQPMTGCKSSDLTEIFTVLPEEPPNDASVCGVMAA
jgi:hypothetical protein